MPNGEHEAFLEYMAAQGYDAPEHRVEVGPVEAEVERDCDYIDAVNDGFAAVLGACEYIER